MLFFHIFVYIHYKVFTYVLKLSIGVSTKSFNVTFRFEIKISGLFYLTIQNIVKYGRKPTLTLWNYFRIYYPILNWTSTKIAWQKPRPLIFRKSWKIYFVLKESYSL